MVWKVNTALDQKLKRCKCNEMGVGDGVSQL